MARRADRSTKLAGRANTPGDEHDLLVWAGAVSSMAALGETFLCTPRAAQCKR